MSPVMHAQLIEGIVVRPLRNGETEVVQSVFDRLGPQSRLFRFGGVKNVLTQSDLELLSRVDGRHHVLVAYAESEPIGIARLVRNGTGAEVAIEVVDDWQQRGVGRILMTRLAEDARAAGIDRLEATVDPENIPTRKLLRRIGVTLVPAALSTSPRAA